MLIGQVFNTQNEYMRVLTTPLSVECVDVYWHESLKHHLVFGVGLDFADKETQQGQTLNLKYL
ncbi:MAG: hypothetical protein CSA81_08975 [Acidobacteria bacterium]|nr:MAG: hypothetical protein CSA81_08975 [Acidobacteriota bacterium]